MRILNVFHIAIAMLIVVFGFFCLFSTYVEREILEPPRNYIMAVIFFTYAGFRFWRVFRSQKSIP